MNQPLDAPCITLLTIRRPVLSDTSEGALAGRVVDNELQASYSGPHPFDDKFASLYYELGEMLREARQKKLYIHNVTLNVSLDEPTDDDSEGDE